MRAPALADKELMRAVFPVMGSTGAELKQFDAWGTFKDGQYKPRLSCSSEQDKEEPVETEVEAVSSCATPAHPRTSADPYRGSKMKHELIDDDAKVDPTQLRELVNKLEQGQEQLRREVGRLQAGQEQILARLEGVLGAVEKIAMHPRELEMLPP